MNIFKMAITFFKIIVSKKIKKEKNGRNLSFLVVLFTSTFKWSHYQEYIQKYPNTSVCCIQSWKYKWHCFAWFLQSNFDLNVWKVYWPCAVRFIVRVAHTCVNCEKISGAWYKCVKAVQGMPTGTLVCTCPSIGVTVDTSHTSMNRPLILW